MSKIYWLSLEKKKEKKKDDPQKKLIISYKASTNIFKR